MRYLSVCSGIESATVAWHPLGWQPVAFSEIEPFPSAVLAHHYPTVPNWGDMTRYQEWPDADVDVLVGGTPCQSFSVAGLRKGLDDPRGNLMLTFGAIAQRYRPRWLVWENVPGVLSSNGGRDFGTFLGMLAELGYGFAYRVLDAQYVRVDSHPRAVPQRRRRVFVVGHLGDWRRAAAVLFERESLSGHPAPRREAGQGTAHDVAPCIGASGRGFGRTGETRGQDPVVVSHDPACTLTAREYKGALPEADLSTVIAHSLRADGFDASEDGTGRGTPLAPTVAPTLVAGGRETPPHGSMDGQHLVPMAFDTTQITSKANYSKPKPGDPCHPLAAGAHPPAVAFNAYQRTVSDVASPIQHDDERKLEKGVMQGMAVRRLTPRECERLQGFPDVRKTVIFEVCHSSDHTPSDAPAGTPSPRSQRSVSTVGDGGCPPSVRNAEQDSSTSHPDPALPVLAHVLIDSERGEVQLLSRGRLLWSASSAGEGSLSPLPIPVDVFARLAAHTITTLVNATHSGRAASPASMTASTHPLSGSAYATVSGPEIVALASDAVKCGAMASDLLKSITSAAGPSSPTSAQTLATSSCCVVAAIASSIPVEILPASSYALSIEVVRGYTDIPWRNKPHAPDGPRYKALGNSMAVNVMSWVGQRIAMVEAIASTAESVA